MKRFGLARCQRAAALLLILAVVSLAPQVSLAPLALAATDPPYRMEEITPEAAHITLSGKGIWGYADANGQYALVPDFTSLRVIDVTDPAHPVVATTVQSVGFDLKEVKTYRHYAYCVNQRGPIQIVDLSDPYHAYTIATYSSPRIPGSHNIWCSDDGYAYVALMGAGNSDLRILDLADPLRPVERGYWQHIEQGGLVACHDVYVRNDTCYASWFNAGLYILDVSDKDFPRQIKRIVYPQQATHNAWPTLDGRHFFTTDERNSPMGHLLAWELDSRYITPVGEYETERAAVIHNVHVKGPLAYISYYTAGVRVIDITNPQVPIEVGRFDTSRYEGPRFEGCWGVYPYAPSGLLYASDMEQGLYVLRFQDANEGIARGFVRIHGNRGARLEGAELVFIEAGVRAVSDRTGYYQAALFPGRHTVRAWHPDFREETLTITVSARGTTEEDVILDPLPGPVEFVAALAVPEHLGDGRLRVAARVRAHDAPVAAVTLRYRSGGAGGFRTVPMLSSDPAREEYAGIIPAQLPGTLVQYFIEAADEAGAAVFAPAGAPTHLLGYEVSPVPWTPVLTADFETDAGGFTVGALEDAGHRGIWERAVPHAAGPDTILIGGRPAQPNADTTADGAGYCFLTELGAPGAPSTAHEVDGRTTLTSPAIELGAAAAARLEFMLWYANDLAGSRWQDPFLIEGSTDGGATWRVLESIRVPGPGWQAVSVDLGSRLPLGDGLRLRFVVAESVSPTLLEAAIDDVRVVTTPGIGVGAPELAPVLLRQNTPNPFNPSTIITFQLKEPRQVTLEVYDVGGHLVRRLLDGPAEPGDHAASWDGRDGRGFAAPSGVYFYRLAAESFTDIRKMLLMK